eukprot:3603534-Amphidinium_carterae.1
MLICELVDVPNSMHVQESKRLPHSQADRRAKTMINQQLTEKYSAGRSSQYYFKHQATEH